MKKTKILSIILVLAVCVCLFEKPAGAKAENNITRALWEVAYTDGAKKKNYSFTMPEDGYFYYYVGVTGGYYLLNKKMVWSKDYYVYTAMECDGTTYINDDKAYFASKDSEWYATAKYPFKKGQTITISVYDADKVIKTGYSVKAYYMAAANIESDNNENKKNAGTLKKGNIYNGSTTPGDVDWYVFKAPSAGNYKFYVSNITEDADELSLPVTVYNSDNEKLSGRKVQNDSEWARVLNADLKKGEKIYIKISEKKNNEMYQIKVK